MLSINAALATLLALILFGCGKPSTQLLPDSNAPSPTPHRRELTTLEFVEQLDNETRGGYGFPFLGNSGYPPGRDFTPVHRGRHTKLYLIFQKNPRRFRLQYIEVTVRAFHSSGVNYVPIAEQFRDGRWRVEQNKIYLAGLATGIRSVQSENSTIQFKFHENIISNGFSGAQVNFKVGYASRSGLTPMFAP